MNFPIHASYNNRGGGGGGNMGLEGGGRREPHHQQQQQQQPHSSPQRNHQSHNHKPSPTVADSNSNSIQNSYYRDIYHCGPIVLTLIATAFDIIAFGTPMWMSATYTPRVDTTVSVSHGLHEICYQNNYCISTDEAYKTSCPTLNDSLFGVKAAIGLGWVCALCGFISFVVTYAYGYVRVVTCGTVSITFSIITNIVGVSLFAAAWSKCPSPTPSYDVGFYLVIVAVGLLIVAALIEGMGLCCSRFRDKGRSNGTNHSNSNNNIHIVVPPPPMSPSGGVKTTTTTAASPTALFSGMGFNNNKVQQPQQQQQPKKPVPPPIDTTSTSVRSEDHNHHQVTKSGLGTTTSVSRQPNLAEFSVVPSNHHDSYPRNALPPASSTDNHHPHINTSMISYSPPPNNNHNTSAIAPTSSDTSHVILYEDDHQYRPSYNTNSNTNRPLLSTTELLISEKEAEIERLRRQLLLSQTNNTNSNAYSPATPSTSNHNNNTNPNPAPPNPTNTTTTTNISSSTMRRLGDKDQQIEYLKQQIRMKQNESLRNQEKQRQQQQQQQQSNRQALSSNSSRLLNEKEQAIQALKSELATLEGGETHTTLFAEQPKKEFRVNSPPTSVNHRSTKERRYELRWSQEHQLYFSPAHGLYYEPEERRWYTIGPAGQWVHAAEPVDL